MVPGARWTKEAALAAALGLAAAGCGAPREAAAWHARQALLEREVEGLRATVGRLEGGQPIFPERALLVAVSEDLVRDFVAAQLPVTVELESYRLELQRAEASFRGSPGVSLSGTIAHKDRPDHVGEVSALGALRSISVDAASGTLRARVGVDHVDLVKMGGLEAFLGGSTLDELARRAGEQLAERLPEIQIPVRIEQDIALPAVSEGPLRLAGARLPLKVSVADVLAGQGLLWIAVDVVPGQAADAGPGVDGAAR